MEPGDIFSIDNDAIVDMENAEFSVMWAETPDKNKKKEKIWHRLTPGTQFRITKTGLEGLPVEVRASKIDSVTGKCSRGRPRRFPAGVVYRLLGEEEPEPAATITPAVYDPTNDPEGAKVADDYLAAQPESEPEPEVEEQSEEDREAREARVQQLLGLVGDENDKEDWGI